MSRFCLSGLAAALLCGLPMAQAEPPAVSAPVAAFPAKGARVILLVSAALPETSLTAEEREKLQADLRKSLEEAVKGEALVAVDPKANEAARKAAEEWAVIQDAPPEKIAEAVRPYAIDGILRVTARISAPIRVQASGEGGKVTWVAPWRLAVESIDTRGKGAKDGWIFPVVSGDPRSAVGKGETVVMACKSATEGMVERFAVALKEKVSGSVVPVPADKKNP